MGNKHICLPFASEALYREYVDHPAQYRQYLSEMLRQYPELFPQDMDQGFTFHDAYVSVKQDVIVRRIKLQTTGAVFTLRPSFVMPYRGASTIRVKFQTAATNVPKLIEVYRVLPGDFCSGFGTVFQGVHRVLTRSRGR